MMPHTHTPTSSGPEISLSDPLAIVKFLQQLVKLFTRVANRIAPEHQQSTPVKFDGVVTVAGYVLPPVYINSSYNQFVNSLVNGTVYVYRGAFQGQQPDFVFSALNNTLPIPMGYLQDSFLTFRVAPSTVGPAAGCVYVNRL